MNENDDTISFDRALKVLKICLSCQVTPQIYPAYNQLSAFILLDFAENMDISMCAIMP